MSELQGLTKEQAIILIEGKSVWTQKEVRTIVHGLKIKTYMHVDKLKIGDIYIHRVLSHPAVVISIKNNICYSLLITSEETTEGILDEAKTRYLIYPSFITATMVSNTVEYAQKNLVAIYGNNKHLAAVKKKFKELIKNL